MEGKVALVTGGASGLGKAFTEILLEHKVKVCVADLDSDLGQKTEAELKQKFGDKQVCFSQCDVTDDIQLEESFKKAINNFGRLDIVVNNAGIVDETNWKLTVSVNLTAVIQGNYLAIKYMGTDKGGKGGVIINTASIAGLVPLDCAPVYTVTKYGVVGLTVSLGAISSKLHGIRLNSLCPVFVDTPLMGKMKRDGAVYRPELVARHSDDMGFIKIRQVAEGLWNLIVDESLSGQCLICCREGNFMADKLPQDYRSALSLFTGYKE